jgi:hypothetical protein
MTKKILLAVGVAALVFTGCASNGHCGGGDSPRFIEIDSSGASFSVYVDTVTNIEYAQSYGYSHSLTPLLDTDGKPLKYDAETGR